MVSVMLVCFAVVSVSVSVSSNDFQGSKPAVPRKKEFPKLLKDARLFTVQALQDSTTQTTDQWKEVNPHHRYSRIQITPEKCKSFVQGLTDSSTGELMWDAHRCTVLTLVYKCHAKVRLLSGGKHVLAEGDDRKELFLEILVDDEHKRVIPLDGIASRDLAMLLVIHQQQDGKTALPDFHIKKQEVLGPDFFGQEHKASYGFDDCA